MSALTTRDALAKAIRSTRVRGDFGDLIAGPELGEWVDFIADHLLASGAVIDAATLADDEALYDRVENEVMVTLAGYGHVDGCWVDVTYAALRALAAALSERAS